MYTGLKKGGRFEIFNGQGLSWELCINNTDNRVINAEVIGLLENDINTQMPLFEILQAVVIEDKMSFVIQKSVELGVGIIKPVICERSKVKLAPEKIENRMKRWNKISAEAARQSMRSDVPAVEYPVKIEDLPLVSDGETAIVLHPATDGKTPGSIKEKLLNSKNIKICIGPEGGFSQRELDLFKNKGYINLKLGKRILRTETAALVILSVLQYICGDYNEG